MNILCGAVFAEEVTLIKNGNPVMIKESKENSTGTIFPGT